VDDHPTGFRIKRWHGLYQLPSCLFVKLGIPSESAEKYFVKLYFLEDVLEHLSEKNREACFLFHFTEKIIQTTIDM
jgi:hypothetical protein